MKEKIIDFKDIVESHGEDLFSLGPALDRMDEKLSEQLLYPGRSEIGEEIDKTISELKDKGDDSEESGGISKRWEKLTRNLERWETDHPGVTLIIGDVARALAAAGL